MKKILLLFLAIPYFSFSNAQCAEFTLTSPYLNFGSTAGVFTFPFVASTDIVNGGTRTSGPHSFDIWDETTGAATPGGADDITDLITSVNTAGTAFESAALIFKDESLVPYGTATYNGFFSWWCFKCAPLLPSNRRPLGFEIWQRTEN
jgi:hypothetical protein